MQNLLTKTVRQIALEAPETTRVFEEFKIDYCCGGQKMFLDACRNAGAEPENVLQKIDRLLQTDKATEPDWLKTATLAGLIDHIEQKHHTYTREELEQLPPLMDKVARVHGDNHPELLEIKEIFQSLCADLTPHLLKEEIILFPYIKELEAGFAKKERVSSPCFGTVQNPVRMMMLEHDRAGELLRDMREISKNYSLPEGACPSYTALFNRFEALELDLHQHIHLENNLLFPKAVELEEKTND
jgi:regulator of cell morphogenesis and NO signaling